MAAEEGEVEVEKTRAGQPGEWEGEGNRALPYWRGASDFISCFSSTLNRPCASFCDFCNQDENALILCACFWIWIPICSIFMLFIGIFILIAATIAAVLGLVQSIIFMLIGGLGPGVIISLGVTGLSIIRMPWNLYYHCATALKDVKKKQFTKGASFLLLLPFHVVVPILVAVISTSAIVVTSVVAFFGYPLTPWKKIPWVFQEFWKHFVTNVQGKEQVEENETEPEASSENYSSTFWLLAEDFLGKTLPSIVTIPFPLFRVANKASVGGKATPLSHKDQCCTGLVIILGFAPLWVLLPIVYFTTFGIIYFVVAIFLVLIGITQCVIHLCLGIWPGIILALDITAISIVRIPWNLYHQCTIGVRTLRKGPGHLIKAVNLFLLLPVQLFLPVLLFLGSLVAGVLAAAGVSLLGCPQVPYRAIKTVHKMAWDRMVTQVDKMATGYGAAVVDDSASQGGSNPTVTEMRRNEENSSLTGMGENYALPYWQAVGEALATLYKALSLPTLYLPSKSPLRKALLFLFWAPVSVIYLLLSILLIVVIAVPFAIVGLLQSLIFLSLGFWPGFIIGFGCTGISIIRVPWNIYYHVLVTYRTVLLRRSLKMWSILLVPPTHFLVPAVIATITFGACVPVSMAASFVGWPQKAWQKMPQLVEKFWHRYVTDVKKYVVNYGHPSGIPQNWNGRIYGMPLDPFHIVMGILFYAYAILPVTLFITVIIVIKAIPIVISAVIAFHNTINYPSAAKSWCETIENFARFDCCKEWGEILSNYGSWAKHLNPANIGTALREYSKEYNPCKCLPKEPKDCEICCLSPCIALVFIFYAIGAACIVLGISILIVLGFILWLVCWIFVLVVPPLLYIGSWIGLLILLPILYTVFWIFCLCITLLYPWPCFVAVALSGPFWAFKVPFVVLKLNLLNPAEMDQSFKLGLRMPYDIMKDMDRYTGKLAWRNWTLWEHPLEDTTDVSAPREIKYWDLFYDRSTLEVWNIIKKNWLTEDDIAEASSTAMIAVPGITILAVLVDSVKRETKDKTLIFWNERNQCSHRARDHRDNISNHFFPLLVQLKAGLRDQSDLDKCQAFISSSLCDGDDEKTKELKEYLENQVVADKDKAKILKVRAEIENLVHSLLRVELMQRILARVCQYDYSRRPVPRKVEEESPLLGGGEDIEMSARR